MGKDGADQDDGLSGEFVTELCRRCAPDWIAICLESHQRGPFDRTAKGRGDGGGVPLLPRWIISLCTRAVYEELVIF